MNLKRRNSRPAGQWGKRLTVAVLFVLAVVMRDTWLSLIAIGGIVPDLLLYFPLFFAIYLPPGQAWIYGAALGLVEDLLSGKYLGLGVLSRTGAVCLASVLGNNLYKENLYNPPLIVFAAVMASGLLYWLCSYPVGLGLSWLLLPVQVLPQALYTAL
ncbi:MAG: rod shape-determining protein MreD, partial [Clostridiales bacterium]